MKSENILVPLGIVGVLLGIISLVVVIFERGVLSLNKAAEHKPKFTYGQCFAKMGLREPWDLDVAGRVYSRGYTKYLVMYADEANRVTLAPKVSWEEDIRTFDSKYQPAPCPDNWRNHTHEKQRESRRNPRHEERH